MPSILGDNAAVFYKAAADTVTTTTKTAIEVSRGDLPSRALASSVGHVGGLLGGLPIMSLRAHEDPTDWVGASGSILDSEISPADARAQKLKALAEKMEQVNPQELGDHRVVLGGTQVLRDVPRIFTNPRTSLLGKALGVASYPINAAMGNLMRGSHYNPFTDTSHVYGNSPAVLSHELGHALDFNADPVPEYSDNEHAAMTWLRRQGYGLKRDGYMLARALSPIMLRQEFRANELSEKNLRKALKDNPDLLNEVFDARQRELPAGIGSYLGAASTPFLGPVGPYAPFAGMLAGRAYGQAEADRMKGRWASTKKKTNQKDNKKNERADEFRQVLRKAAAEASAAPANITIPENLLTAPPEYRLPAKALRQMFTDHATRNAPNDPAMQERANFFTDVLLKHRKTPELAVDVGALPRSTLPAAAANDHDMRALGFLPSYVAVPERGQTQLRTWRHPNTGMHLHRHGDRWLFHEDNWPSFSMQMAKYKKENPGASLGATAGFGARTFLQDSLPHVMYEGVPGYVNYVYNTIMGNPTFTSMLDHTYKLKTLPDKFGRGLAASVLLGAAASGLGQNPANFYRGTGAGIGFLGGNVLSKHVQNALQKYNPNLRNPGPGNLALTAGIPLATTLMGSSLGKRVYDSILARRKQLAQEKAKAKKIPARGGYALGYA